MSRKTTLSVTTIGIDIGKNTFHLIGFDEKGAIVLRQKLSRVAWPCAQTDVDRRSYRSRPHFQAR